MTVSSLSLRQLVGDIDLCIAIRRTDVVPHPLVLDRSAPTHRQLGQCKVQTTASRCSKPDRHLNRGLRVAAWWVDVRSTPWSARRHKNICSTLYCPSCAVEAR